jgi:hypothetical protein
MIPLVDMRAGIIPPKYQSGEDVKRSGKEIHMKREFLRLGMTGSYVFKRLVMVCILIVGCAGLSFGGGNKESIGDEPGLKPRLPAEAGVIAEVEEGVYIPNRNPDAGTASTAVYAEPAAQLKPERERLPTPVYAISGVRNQEIHESTPGQEAVDIVVILPERETFSRGLVEGADVSDWILNLPAGLEGRAHNVKKGATSIRIYVAGTPTVTARAEIRVRIPGTYLTGGTDKLFDSPTEAESISAWEADQTAQE